jgi:hypothetical protein
VDRLGSVTSDEMREIDLAIAVQLGLPRPA